MAQKEEFIAQLTNNNEKKDQDKEDRLNQNNNNMMTTQPIQTNGGDNFNSGGSEIDGPVNDLTVNSAQNTDNVSNTRNVTNITNVENITNQHSSNFADISSKNNGHNGNTGNTGNNGKMTNLSVTVYPNRNEIRETRLRKQKHSRLKRGYKLKKDIDEHLNGTGFCDKLGWACSSSCKNKNENYESGNEEALDYPMYGATAPGGFSSTNDETESERDLGQFN